MRTWSKMIKGMGALALAGALFTGGQVNAAVDHTLNFSDAAAADGAAGLGLSNVAGVNLWNFDFEAISVFNDANDNNLPDPGESFTEWVLIQVTDLRNAANDRLTGAGKPDATYGADHEITAALQITGTLGAPTGSDFPFTVSGLPQFDIFFDAGDNGANGAFTGSSYTAGAGTFTDGVLVETGTFLSGKGDQDTSNPYDGNLDLFVQLDDKLGEINGYDAFELDALGQALVNEISTFAVAVTTSNPFLNDLDATRRANLAAFAGGVTVGDKSGILPVGFFEGDDNELVGFVRGSGQLRKEIIPEPVTATMSLMGLGALAAGAMRRRRA